MKLFAFLFAASAAAEVYLSESFGDDAWRSRWVDAPRKDGGSVDVAAFNHRDDATDKGLKTMDDARFYTTSVKFDKDFKNEGKTLVFQFTAQHPAKFDCGGAYFKLFPAGTDLKGINGDSKYNIMFGPDICGYGTSKVHAIFEYNGKNVEKTEEVKLDYNDKNEFSHLYRLVVNPDNTYDIQFDGKSKASGSLAEDWPFLEPKQIDDPADKKPADWVDEAMIDDPEDKKPEGYDDIAEKIKDPAAKQPDDWDTEMDGDWEAPEIPNPEFKGPWSAKRIDNPAYKGVWAAKKIDNPAYKPDDTIYSYESFGAASLEVWQVQAGTIFDNILVTDSVEHADKVAKESWEGLAEVEKKNKEAADKVEADKKAAEEAAKKEAEADDDDDEDEKKPAEEKKTEL